jgi:hypothetical protein
MASSQIPNQDGVVEANISSGENDSLFQVMSHLQLAMEGCHGSLTELEQWKSRAMTAELMNEQFAKTIDDCTKTIDDYEKQLASWKTRALLAEEGLRDHGHIITGGSGNYNVINSLMESEQKEAKSHSHHESNLRESANEEKRDDILDDALMIDVDEDSCYSNLVSDQDSTSVLSEPEFEVNNEAKQIFRSRRWERDEMVESPKKSNSGKRGLRRHFVSSGD